MSKSSEYQVKAFFSEFPFLMAEGGPITNPDFIAGIEEVSVSRIDRDFLERKARRFTASGNLVDIDDAVRIVLLDASGAELGEVRQEEEARHNEAHRDDEYEEGERVGDAVSRLGAERVAMALEIHTGYEIVDHHSRGGAKVTLYKSPKGFTIQEWVREQTKSAESRLKATLASINGEAEMLVCSWITGDDGTEFAYQGLKLLREVVLPLVSPGTGKGVHQQRGTADYSLWWVNGWWVKYRTERTNVSVRPLEGGRYHQIIATPGPTDPPEPEE